jgi:hypothetical protein
VHCDDYQVFSAHGSHHYWTLLCFGWLENNKKLMSFHTLTPWSSLPFRASTLV